MFFTDRSRIETTQICERERFLVYHYKGVGVVPKGEAIDLAFGKGFHAALDIVNQGRPIGEAEEQLKFELRDIEGVTQDDLPKRDEMFALGKGLLHSYVRSFLPSFLQDYEWLPQCAEQEILLPISEGLTQMIRIDGAALRKHDQQPVCVEFKTDSYLDSLWERYTYNTQVLMEAKALEGSLGERVPGTLVVGFNKGRMNKGKGRRMSPFTYLYTDGEGFTTSWTKRKGWNIRPSWEFPGLGKWIDKNLVGMCTEALDERSVIAHYFPVDEWRFEKIKRHQQTVEQRVEEGLASVDVEKTDSEEHDLAFPQNFGMCLNHGGFNKPCPYQDICHNVVVGEAPEKSGLYQWRDPNHPLERTMIEGNG